MTPKNKLFIGIFAFLIIVNILIIFDLNYFYIRAILGFVFLITIPGLLIMLCLKIRNINFWEYLVYTVGLSVAFIMFAGLAVNWILPALGITDKPLSLYPILICFDIFLLILWIIAQRRNEDNVHLLIFPFGEYKITPKPKSLFSITSKKQASRAEENIKPKELLKEQNLKKSKFNFIPKFPSLSWLDRIFIIIPFFFPFMAVIGAFLLNNHGTNIITMIMLGSIAVYVFCIVLFRDKLNENVYPWALWMISLSLLLMFSMRSWYISGWDIQTEYRVFTLTQEKGFWSIFNLNNTYNSCISIAILPNILYLFLKINDLYILKLLFPIIFCIVPLILFILLKGFSKRIIAFLAGFFFVSQLWFIQQMPALARQQIAFLFFGLMLLVLFSKEINPKIKNLLFVIFGFSMIVSHYSTSYIALALFLLTYILTFFYKKWENRKIKKGKLKTEQREQFYLTEIIILLLLIFGFLWYSQVTTTANGLIDFMHKSINNMGNMFSEEMLDTGIKQFSFGLNPASMKDITEYAQNTELNYKTNKTYLNYYNPGDYKEYNLRLTNSQTVTTKYPPVLIPLLIKFFRIIKILCNQIFIFLGFIIILFLRFKKKEGNFTYISMCFVSMVFLMMIISLPLVSSDYNLTRAYLQLLMILTLLGIIGGLNMFRATKKEYVIIAFIFIVYFLFYSGFIFQFIGGAAFTTLNNFGEDHDQLYIHNTELSSANWLYNHYQIKSLVYADYVARLRLDYFLKKYVIIDILPSTIDRKSYVYSIEVNNLGGRTYNKFKADLLLSYNFPTNFLNDNKNKIYNNGGSEIFK